MSSGSSPKQPLKRRRLNSKQSTDEIVPLDPPDAASNSTKKKVSNKSKFASLACPTFSKASKLLKELPNNKNGESSEENANTSHSANSTQGEVLPVASDSKTCSISSRLRSRNKTQTFANKILNYFKPMPHSSKSKQALASEVPSTSGLQKVKENNVTFFKHIKNYYGLLGEESYDENSVNYFERLPIHITETILCQIPFLDLVKCRLVCTQWNEVINNNKFMKWKKTYYGVKFENPVYHKYMEALCHCWKLTSVDGCFALLIKYMSKSYGRQPSSDMLDLLMTTDKGILANNTITERFPELSTRDCRAWAVLAVVVLLSETIWDIYTVYRSLFTTKSSCSLHDVTDAMYCIATFLWHFQLVYHINHGLHYRIYYNLYLIENNLPPQNGSTSVQVPRGLPGQQSMHVYSEPSQSFTNLTYEQIRILNHRLQPEQIIKIIALAGTGKTTTLVHFARLYPQVKFLNVMFNKAVCDEAKIRFPPNVTCKTAHSLAYKQYGQALQPKLTLKLRPHDMVSLLQHHQGTQLHLFSYAKHVLSILTKFMTSSGKEIEWGTLPNSDGTAPISQEDRTKLYQDAVSIWRQMADSSNRKAKVTHDTYLKLYQLSKPCLSQFHCILVDEAQDCNEAMLDIILSQRVPVILVGDPFQQIYEFRGAINALQSVVATHTYHLTKSFRFGPQIAYVASCVLHALKQHTSTTLVGSTKPSTVSGEVQGQYAIICRSNIQLFSEAVRICCLRRLKEFEPSEIRGAFTGGYKSYNFEQMLDIYKLSIKLGEKDVVLKDKFISKFGSYKELLSYAKRTEDTDLLNKIEIVQHHNHHIPDYLRIIKETCSCPIELANVVFSTAHKAKGLEFDTVSLTEDYQVARVISTRTVDLFEEYSILYVALTRAKKSLLLPDKLIKVLARAQEKFEYPVCAQKLLEDKNELTCLHCTRSFVPHTALVLCRRQVVLANGRVIEAGPMCLVCSTEPMFRPQIHNEHLVMYLDPSHDYVHRSMASLVGPLPSDPPIQRSDFREMEVVYVINVNL